MPTRPFSRTAARAAVVSAALALLCLLAAAALLIAAQPRQTPVDVEVIDGAGVLDPVLVAEDVSALRFHAPVRVVVWTREGEYADNINEETLGFARAHPELELLSPDGRYFSDGLLLLTVSVEENERYGSGQVGTYFGENVKVEPTSAQQALQEHGYADFQARDWAAGTAAVAEAAAGEMARPAWTRPAVTLGLPAALALALLLNAGGVLYQRRRFEALCAEFDANTADVHARVTAAELVLDHGMGSRIRQTAGAVLREYDDTLTLREQFDARRIWTVTAANPALWSGLRRFAENTEDIADASAMLDRATTLYHREETWETVWEQEIGETREQLEAALKDQTIRRAAGSDAARRLTEFARAGLVRLEEVRLRGLRGSGENIVECLDEIAEIRRELTEQMRRIESAALAGSAAQTRHVERAIAKERRARSRSFRSVTGYYDRSVFYSPRTFALGYVAGVANHRRAEQAKARARSSNSGSTRGFGSSGGGFRGSGSSSRF
ncbi:DUF5129 domain-containing protein [Brevibacterium album]|uniref:DUF5129 domain-containing protein n=1 Tax=Brevibacterium album TaxID=417948 RepID=UPI0003FF29A3|nr:DUF5129 domain-containing protein [Brevibacterium album]